MWEIPSAALALWPSYGPDRVDALLTDIEPRMQPDERDRWRALKPAVNNSRAYKKGLTEWMRENNPPSAKPDPRDATAEADVDRVMKRLGYHPANPESRVYDSFADFAVPIYAFDVGSGGPLADED